MKMICDWLHQDLVVCVNSANSELEKNHHLAVVDHVT